jgi:hypothetical protein
MMDAGNNVTTGDFFNSPTVTCFSPVKGITNSHCFLAFIIGNSLLDIGYSSSLPLLCGLGAGACPERSRMGVRHLQLFGQGMPCPYKDL